MDIKTCVAELMQEHNCVVIPGFGGFIGNYSPAYIDPMHHTFHPPSKKLLFNVNLHRNDGLVANRLSEVNGISFMEACRMLDRFSEDCRDSLHRGQPVIWPSIGRLIPGPEDTIMFEQDLNTNLLPGAFGLNHFMSPPVIRRTVVPVQPLQDHKSDFPGSGSLTQLLRWAAFFALPVGTIALMGITGFDTINSKLSSAGIFSSVAERFSSSSQVDKRMAPSNLIPEKNTAILAEPVEVDIAAASTEPASTLSQQSTETAVADDLSSDDPFAVIVGAFRHRDNAERYISELKADGHHAILYDISATGLHRVAIGTSPDRKVALQLLARALSEDFDGAWLLSK